MSEIKLGEVLKQFRSLPPESLEALSTLAGDISTGDIQTKDALAVALAGGKYGALASVPGVSDMLTDGFDGIIENIDLLRTFLPVNTV